MKNETEKWREYLYSRIAKVEKPKRPKALPEKKQKIFEMLCRKQNE